MRINAEPVFNLNTCLGGQVATADAGTQPPASGVGVKLFNSVFETCFAQHRYE